MATTIPSVVQDDVISNVIVVDEADAGKIEVIASEDGVSSEITISSPIEGLNLGLKGEENTEITGARLTDASFINEVIEEVCNPKINFVEKNKSLRIPKIIACDGTIKEDSPLTIAFSHERGNLSLYSRK